MALQLTSKQQRYADALPPKGRLWTMYGKARMYYSLKNVVELLGISVDTAKWEIMVEYIDKVYFDLDAGLFTYKLNADYRWLHVEAAEIFDMFVKRSDPNKQGAQPWKS